MCGVTRDKKNNKNHHQAEPSSSTVVLLVLYSLESEPLEFITNTCMIETKILEHLCVHQHKKLLFVLGK